MTNFSKNVAAYLALSVLAAAWTLSPAIAYGPVQAADAVPTAPAAQLDQIQANQVQPDQMQSAQAQPDQRQPDQLPSSQLPSGQAQLQTTPPSVRPFDYVPEPPVAQVTPQGNTVDIRLVNTIGAPITYQVVTDTEQRSLPANSDVVLRDLALPVSVFMYRPDTGLIVPTAATAPGELQLTLEAATDFADNVRSVELDSSGYVFFE